MYLVTGGAGFIGSALIHQINTQWKHGDIILVDIFKSDESWKNIASLQFADVLNPSQDFPWTEIKGIFHLGACSSTTERDMGYLLKNNFEFSKFLFNKATELDIPFIYASSAATYGAGELGYSDEHKDIHKLRPLNAYGYSKQLFDLWALRQKTTPSLWVGLKFFNVYGPNEYHKQNMVSVVYQAHKKIKEEGIVRLFESHNPDYTHGEQKRDFIYVKDVTRAMLEMHSTLNPSQSGIYNLGTGLARSFNDLAKATFKALKREEHIEYFAMPENIRQQYQYFTEAKMQKFNQALPNFHFHSLEAGIHDYVVNYLEKDCPYL